MKIRLLFCGIQLFCLGILIDICRWKINKDVGKYKLSSTRLVNLDNLITDLGRHWIKVERKYTYIYQILKLYQVFIKKGDC